MSLLACVLAQLLSRDIIRTAQKPVMGTLRGGLAQRQSRCRRSGRKSHKSRRKAYVERSLCQYLGLGHIVSRNEETHPFNLKSQSKVQHCDELLIVTSIQAQRLNL